MKPPAYDDFGHRVDLTVLIAKTWMRLNAPLGKMSEPISQKDLQKIVKYVNNA